MKKNCHVAEQKPIGFCVAARRDFRHKNGAVSPVRKAKKPASDSLTGFSFITSLTITYFHTGCSTII
ncbi:hypothetical protein, partial [Zemynaea arenosa]|uniref:hypothetical protein n=1 Tax=Zemynaea arenosa TaxID=2561931 RepID=UPI001C6FFA27